jgi:transcriptional regulator GlxA family with amidase domain
LAALRSRDPWSRRIAELEIEATLRRLALTRAPLRPEPTARARGGMVEAIGAWLGARYREQVRVADCARAVGLHPRYAMPLFRRACGMTIGQYLLRLRLAHAQHQLLTTDRDVLAIALDSGFGSQSRFYLQFKRAFGMPPAAYRRSGGR